MAGSNAVDGPAPLLLFDRGGRSGVAFECSLTLDSPLFFAPAGVFDLVFEDIVINQK